MRSKNQIDFKGESCGFGNAVFAMCESTATGAPVALGAATGKMELQRFALHDRRNVVPGSEVSRLNSYYFYQFYMLFFAQCEYFFLINLFAMVYRRYIRCEI